MAGAPDASRVKPFEAKFGIRGEESIKLVEVDRGRLVRLGVVIVVDPDSIFEPSVFQDFDNGGAS